MLNLFNSDINDYLEKIDVGIRETTNINLGSGTTDMSLFSAIQNGNFRHEIGKKS